MPDLPLSVTDYSGVAGDLPLSAADYSANAGDLPLAATDSAGEGVAGCECCDATLCCLSTFSTTCFFLQADPPVLGTVPEGGIVLTSTVGFSDFAITYYTYQTATDEATGQQGCLLTKIQVVGQCLENGDIQITGYVARQADATGAEDANPCWIVATEFGAGGGAPEQQDSFSEVVPAPADCNAPVTVGPFAIPDLIIEHTATGSVWTFPGFDLTFGFDRGSECGFAAGDSITESGEILSRPGGVWVGSSTQPGAVGAPQYVVYNCCVTPPPPLPTFNCSDGGCVDPLDGTGYYNDTNGGLTACLAVCTSPLGDSGDSGEGERDPVENLACCPGKRFPRQVSVAIENISNCPCLEGLYTLVFQNGLKAWFLSTFGCGTFIQLAFYCTGGQYAFKVWLNGVLAGMSGPTEPALPCCPLSTSFLLVIDTGLGICNTGAQLQISVTSDDSIDCVEGGGDT